MIALHRCKERLSAAHLVCTSYKTGTSDGIVVERQQMDLAQTGGLASSWLVYTEKPGAGTDFFCKFEGGGLTRMEKSALGLLVCAPCACTTLLDWVGGIFHFT